MVANFEYHSVRVYAEKTLESCTSCPFWTVDTKTLETGVCFITGTEIPLDEKPDMERMKDCPLIIRNVNTTKRLTIDTKIPFCDIAQCASYQGGPYCQDGKCDQRRVYEKLREYERTGKEPGDIENMAPAIEVSKIRTYLQSKLKEWNSLGDRKWEPANMWGYNFLMACFDDLNNFTEKQEE